MGRLLRVTSGGAWVLGAACLSLLALGGALDPPGWVGGAPAPYPKKPSPPVTAAEAAGPYRLLFPESDWVEVRCVPHPGGRYAATYRGEAWAGWWRVRGGRVHVGEWPAAGTAGPHAEVRWSFPLRRRRGGRVARDGLKCRE